MRRVGSWVCPVGLLESSRRLIEASLNEQRAAQMIVGAHADETEAQRFAGSLFSAHAVGRLLIGERPRQIVPSEGVFGIETHGFLIFGGASCIVVVIRLDR